MSSGEPEPATLGRGDIVLTADRQGESTGKPRPAVVVQSSLFADTATVTVALITSIEVIEVDALLLRLALPANEATGFEVANWVAVDQLATVRRSRIRGPIGALDGTTLHELDQAILLFLGFTDLWAARAR